MSETKALAEINKAEAALERAAGIHEMLNLRDASMAWAIFADAQGFTKAAQKAKIFQLRAERKAGAWLKKYGPKPGRRSPNSSKLEELGIDPHESHRWQLEAELAEARFKKWTNDCLESGKEISAAGLRREARGEQREKRIEEDIQVAQELPAKGANFDLKTMAFSAYKGGAGQAAAVITDPPYSDDYLELYEQLGSFSEYHLRDGGSLLALVGQASLPAVIEALSTYLKYHWTLAYVMPGAHLMMYQLRINNAWKPVLWFVKGKYDGQAVTDLVTAIGREKDAFEWQQGEVGFAELVSDFSRPGDLVIDPMCGTGTTGVVAASLGRKFIGIDNDPNRIATAKRRINERIQGKEGTQ